MTAHRTPAAAVVTALVFSFVWCGGGTEVRADVDDEAFADVSPWLGTTRSLRVRGRIVEEDDPVDRLESRPIKEASQDEVDDAPVGFFAFVGGVERRLGDRKADEEGYFDARLDLVRHRFGPGDIKIGIRHGGRVIGEARARLLSTEFGGVVIRSDVDLTYLSTDFHSKTAMAKLLTQKAKDRVALPGMPAVYRALRRGSGADTNRPIVFLSGSPRFFKRTLEGKMQLDGVVHDGLVLKPFKDIISARLLALEPQRIVPELEEQIGYKLRALLEARLDLPLGARELLMGDDSEADFAVYALYHRFMSHGLDVAGLLAELDRVGVSSGWRAQIAVLAPRVRAALPAPRPVVGIYIRATDKPSAKMKVDDWRIAGLTRVHRGTWPLALDLFEEGLIDEAGVRSVASALDARGVSAADRAIRADAAVRNGDLKAETVAKF